MQTGLPQDTDSPVGLSRPELSCTVNGTMLSLSSLSTKSMRPSGLKVKNRGVRPSDAWAPMNVRRPVPGSIRKIAMLS